MKGSYKAGRSMEFSVAAWDNIWHAEREQRVHIVVQALPANQRGVFVFDIKAVALEDEPEAHPLARVTDTWPNSHEAPFETFLYQMTFKLLAMCEAARKERQSFARR